MDNPDYKAAVANADAIKKQLDDARQSGSGDISTLGQQYLNALTRLSTMKNAINNDPAIAAAKWKANAATKVVATIQSEIDRLAAINKTERPSGFSEAQWEVVRQSVECRRRLQKDAAGASGDIYKVEAQQILRTTAGKFLVPDLIIDRARVGLTGVLKDHLGLDPDLYANSDAVFQVEQILSSSEMMVTKDSARFWISGFPTDGLVSDRYINLPGCWFVAGTKTYTTVIGVTSTIFVFKPVDTTNLQQAVDWLLSQNGQSQGIVSGQ